MQKHTVRPDTADSYKNLPVSQREVSPAAAPCNHIISKLKKGKIWTLLISELQSPKINDEYLKLR